MTDAHLIGLDWGTTSLRAYLFTSNGDIAASRQLTAGILQLARAGDAEAGFERALAEACGDWRTTGSSPAIIACGMVGSAQGWREAAYLEVPTTLDELGRRLTEVALRSGGALHIIPGLIERGALPNVMRGEETQIAGVLERAAPLTPRGGDLLVGLPGSHSKWVRIRDGAVVHFHTFMTGEVFAALCDHTLLGRTMRPAATPDLGAFDRGVEIARSPHGRAGVLSTMFSTRTLGLVGELAGEAQADYLSGLLIGHELVAIAQLDEPAAAIVLAGSAELCERYRRALAAFGQPPAVVAAGATERGLWRVACTAGLVARSPAC